LSTHHSQRSMKGLPCPTGMILKTQTTPLPAIAPMHRSWIKLVAWLLQRLLSQCHLLIGDSTTLVSRSSRRCDLTLLPTAHTLLPTAHTLLPTAHTLLPTVHTLPPTAHTPLPAGLTHLLIGLTHLLIDLLHLSTDPSHLPTDSSQHRLLADLLLDPFVGLASCPESTQVSVTTTQTLAWSHHSTMILEDHHYHSQPAHTPSSVLSTAVDHRLNNHMNSHLLTRL
jgi:hypothetical protein